MMHQRTIVSSNVYYLEQAAQQPRLTLLLVHEYQAQLQQWQQTFAQDFRITTAHDGFDALRKLLDEDIDLILSSTELQDISALEVCKFVNKHVTTAHIQCIFVAKHYSEIEEEKLLQAGAIDYLSPDAGKKILFNRVKNQMKLVGRSKTLEQVSKTDALTGIANRMQFDSLLQQEWHAAVREQHPLAVIILDIDHFKLYNDAFGHMQGDECLKQVARALSQAVKRPKDLMARFGGEEFVALLPATELTGARLLAKTLIDKVNKLAIQHAPGAKYPHISVSAGVAACSPNRADEGSFNEADLLDKADMKLYQAKIRGRNCYC
ncbi:diguanylate cyclase domain-containing protein [Thalassomonas haliotis]|uniref:diguanylate cyclase n=1 Tax=Thalassomonas haliotis TaxID=485448 RepID=A0ABY7VGG4_9GAMM|nr:diguanylate cyclase [Thalassomonas haliotis]WDE12517.1 diguanylate cyclase [Thalassomonas haliotis]